MPTTRRTFLAGSVAAFATGHTAAEDREPSSHRAEAAEKTACLDFGRSFICNSAEFNAVRFWVESRTTVVDEANGTSREFLQGGSCKAEHTFAEKGLFIEDNYDFLPILGGEEWLIFRRPARLSDTYRQVRSTADVWGEPILKLKTGNRVRELETWDAIRDATAAGTPLVSRTELRNDETGLRAVVECPVKTMNVSLEQRKYQVDTGPIAFPDLSRRYEKPIDSLSLAFLAFNAPHFADFIVEQPTPLVEDGRELVKVYHYSNPFSLPARNRLFAVEG